MQKENELQVKKVWVLKSSGDKFIALDSASGGYPYETDFWSAKKFATEKDALDYMGLDRDEGWQLYACDEVGLKRVLIIDPYEAELAALKKKYNKE